MMKKFLLTFSLAGMALIVSSCGDCPKENPASPNDKMKASANKLYEAFSTGNLALLDSVISPEAVDHTPDPMMPVKEKKGPAMAKEIVQMIRTGFPDLKMEVTKMVIEGKMVGVFGTMVGTNTGAMDPSMPATGKSMNIYFADFLEFDDKGMITGRRGISDNASMMLQLGLMPMPGGDSTAARPGGDSVAVHH